MDFSGNFRQPILEYSQFGGGSVEPLKILRKIENFPPESPSKNSPTKKRFSINFHGKKSAEEKKNERKFKSNSVNESLMNFFSVDSKNSRTPSVQSLSPSTISPQLSVYKGIIKNENSPKMEKKLRFGLKKISMIFFF